MRMTVRKKLVFGFLIMIALIGIVGRVALVNINKLSDACRLSNRQSLIADYSNQIEIGILECRRAEKAHPLPGNRAPQASQRPFLRYPGCGESADREAACLCPGRRTDTR